MIDGGLGSCALREPVVAAVVRDALHHFDGARYRLIASVIMPNHVHALIEQAGGFPLGDIVHAWKSFTAKQANKQLGRTGAFWAPDYFDRFIRDQTYFDVAVHYIHENPVKAGLVARAEEWRWSSACEDTGPRASRPLISLRKKERARRPRSQARRRSHKKTEPRFRGSAKLQPQRLMTWLTSPEP